MRLSVGPAIKSTPITTEKTNGMVTATIKAAQRPRKIKRMTETARMAIIKCSTNWVTVRSAFIPSSRVITILTA